MSPLGTLFPSRGALNAGSRAAAVGLGVLVNVGGAILVVGTVSCCLHTLPLFSDFGVNIFDYAGVAELPALGLRRALGTSFAMAVVLTMAVAASIGAIRLHQAEEKYQALRALHAAKPWHERFVELCIPWILARNVALPFLAMVGAGYLAVATCQPALAIERTLLRSQSACVHFLTWTSAAQSPSPPFDAGHCVAIVGMVGQHAVLYVDGMTHVVPRSAIASIRFRPTFATDAAVKAKLVQPGTVSN